MGVEKDHTKKIFGRILNERRTEQKISHVELEDRSGITRKHIYNLEKGIHEPTLSVIINLANALDIEPDQMMRMIMKRLND
ncbi:MAG: helix-turn-helix transcriptional regulator [Balneolaceae bacterium]